MNEYETDQERHDFYFSNGGLLLDNSLAINTFRWRGLTFVMIGFRLNPGTKAKDISQVVKAKKTQMYLRIDREGESRELADRGRLQLEHPRIKDLPPRHLIHRSHTRLGRNNQARESTIRFDFRISLRLDP